MAVRGTATALFFPAAQAVVPEIVEAAIRKGAKLIWMQEGVIHQKAAEKARKAGAFVVMDRCILLEHRARFR